MHVLRLCTALLVLTAQGAAMAETWLDGTTQCRCTHGPGVRCRCKHHGVPAEKPRCHQTAAPENGDESGCQQPCCAERAQGPAAATAWVASAARPMTAVTVVREAPFPEPEALRTRCALRPAKPPPRAA